MTALPAFLLLALQALQPLSGEGVSWEQVSADSTSAAFIDPASVRRSGDSVRFLARNVQRGQPGSLLVDMELDCQSTSIVLHAVTLELAGERGEPERIAIAPDRLDVGRGLAHDSEADRLLYARACGGTLPVRGDGP